MSLARSAGLRIHRARLACWSRLFHSSSVVTEGAQPSEQLSGKSRPHMERKELLVNINKFCEKTGVGLSSVDDRAQQRPMRIPWTLPGQTVRVLAPGRRVADATLLDVITDVPKLALPKCPYFTSCGGCKLQHIPYEQQLKWKAANVKAAFEAQGISVSEELWKPIAPSPSTYAYRNRCDFTIGSSEWTINADSASRRSVCVPQLPSTSQSPVAVGFRAATTSRGWVDKVLSVTRCEVMNEDMNSLLKCVRSTLEGHGELVGLVSEVMIRCGENDAGGELLINFRMTNDIPSPAPADILPAPFISQLLDNIPVGLRSRTSVVATHHKSTVPRTVTKTIASKFPGDPEAQMMEVAKYRRGEIVVFHGSGTYRTTISGVTMSVSPNSFCQTNTAGATVLANLVAEACQELPNLKSSTLFDFFCGSGTMSLPLCRTFGSVVGFDNDAFAIESANCNAKDNGFENANYHFRDLSMDASTLRASVAFTKDDVVIVDPPRPGLHSDFVYLLAKLREYRRLVYVSCNYETQARDLALLLSLAPDLKIVSIQPVDMFPHTPHVECIAVIDRIVP